MDAVLLAGLREKYATMVEMRRQHAAGEEDAQLVREQMRTLAARFPGALRELDESPMEILEGRLIEVERALAGDRPPPWAELVALYHGYLRVALDLKRRFGREDLAGVHDWVRIGYQPEVGEPPREELIEVLPFLLRPPGGRLSAWVLGRVGAQLGLAPSTVGLWFSSRPVSTRNA